MLKNRIGLHFKTTCEYLKYLGRTYKAIAFKDEPFDFSLNYNAYSYLKGNAKQGNLSFMSIYIGCPHWIVQNWHAPTCLKSLRPFKATAQQLQGSDHSTIVIVLTITDFIGSLNHRPLNSVKWNYQV